MSAFSFSFNLNPLSRHRTSNRTKTHNWAISVLDLTIGRPVPKLKSHGFLWEKLTGVSLTCVSSRTWRQHKSDQRKGSNKTNNESKALVRRTSGIKVLYVVLQNCQSFHPMSLFLLFFLPHHFFFPNHAIHSGNLLNNRDGASYPPQL